MLRFSPGRVSALARILLSVEAESGGPVGAVPGSGLLVPTPADPSWWLSR